MGRSMFNDDEVYVDDDLVRALLSRVNKEYRKYNTRITEKTNWMTISLGRTRCKLVNDMIIEQGMQVDYLGTMLTSDAGADILQNTN